MSAVGLTWLLSGLTASTNGWLFLLGQTVAALPYGFLVQMLLSFPDGRLHSRLEYAVVTAVWFDVTLMEWLPLPFLQFPRASGCQGCPRNPVLIADHLGAARAVADVQVAIAIFIAAGLMVALVKRWRALPATQRRALRAVLWTGALALIVLIAALAAKVSGTPTPLASTIYLAGLLPLALVPYSFLAGLMQSRFTRAAAVNELVAQLSAGTARHRDLCDALAQAFGDASLTVVYWLPERALYVDTVGRPVTLPEPGGVQTWTPIDRDGAPLAAIVHDAALADERRLLETAGAAAGLAMENERLHAELRARVDELERSRERLIEAGLAERRKLERDLHDGAQQRLVALALSLRLARDRLGREPEAARDLLNEAMLELESATGELRELARGIHPAVLSDRGLTVAVKALAGRLAVPVELVSSPSERLPPRVEVASYYVVAEALTNVARYSHAHTAEVRITTVNGFLAVEVSDDGVGGADPRRGSGLRGLADRVSALDGRLEVNSPPGRGTTVRARIPCG